MISWLDILIALREGKFKYDNGISPRMIIGGCQMPIGARFSNGKEAFRKTHLLIEEMQRYNVGGLIVTHSLCYNLNGPVVYLIDSKWSTESFGISFEDIWARYGNEITHGDYHITKHDMHVLTELSK